MRFILLITLHLPLFGLFGQTNNLRFEQLSTKDGLSHSIITCTLQDREGFVWIGTKDGLNRFDGYNFLIFEHEPGDKTSISNNSILCLYEDYEGSLWVGTEGGLNKLDKRTNTFRVYRHHAASSLSLSHDHVNTIYEDRFRTLWIGTYAGLNKLDKQTDGFTLYEHRPNDPDKWANNEIQKIYEDRQGNIWLGTNRGISRFDRKSHAFTRYSLPGIASHDIDPRHSVRDILEDRMGVLWVATTGDGLAAFDRETGQFKVYAPDPNDPNSISSTHIMTLFEDSFGTLWVGTQDQGLCRFDRSKEQFIRNRLDPVSLKATCHNSITSLYEDRSKVLWVGTYEGGLNKMDLLSKKFTHLLHDPGNNNSIRKNDVTALYEDGTGAIWIGNGAGLDKLDRKTGEYTHYNYPAPAPKNLWENNARCIYEDNEGHLWIGLWGGGLKKLNRKTKQFTSYLYNPGDSTGLPNGIVNSIYQDKKDRFWIGTHYGLAHLDKETGKFITYKPSFINTRRFEINKISEDDSGKLWLATGQYGLLTFDPHEHHFTRYVDKGNTLQENTKAIHNIYEDQTGRLWICLKDGGLLYLDRQTAVCHPIIEPKRLTKTVINGILEDEKGNLWLSTSKNGIYKFNPSTKDLAIYDASDGLQANEFSSACFKGVGGEMYFGGKNGFNIFHPDSIRGNPYAPPVAISSFKVFDKPRSFSNEISLPYYENFISFDFVALSYALPLKNEYAYRLEGFDKDWVQSGTRRYVSFTNLEPGEYVFRVKAANHDGTWNNKGASVKIIISPPLWRTTEAYILYVLVFICIMAGLRRYIIAQERLKNNLLLSKLESDKLMELDQLKSRFFTNISHEFRTPLTLILSPLEKNLSSKEKGHFLEPEVRFMHRNAKRLLELINQLLDISKLEAKKMQWEPKSGDVIPLLKAIVFSFLSLAESKQIKLIFESDVNSLITLFDKDKLEKMITNLLSNALKFTPEGEVKVSVSIKTTGKNKWMVIEVKDTGIGIPESRISKIFDRFYQVDNSYTREFEGTGIGLTLTKELVELQQGTIRVTSTEGIGTCFTVELPVSEATNEISITRNEQQISELQQIGQSIQQEPILPEEELQTQVDVQSPLLLIVEDNTDLRSYIHAIFQYQYRIIEASNGKDGLQLALDTTPDLIISDWMMPKMDGVQLCHQIKTDERTSHIPLILLTAKATVQSKMEGLETGADDYITKPFHTEELFIRAKNLIAQRKSLRERWSKEFATPSSTTIAASKPISASTMSVIDDKFLQRVIRVIEDNIDNQDFTIESLEKEVGMSHSNFNRKIKAVTDQSPNEFLRNYRLQQAALLLLKKDRSVSEVAYQVGFSTLSYFTKCFRQIYGVVPSEYADSLTKTEQLR